MPDAPASVHGAAWSRDLVAGLVVFLVAIPLCLGIALASGAPLQSGLISGIVGGLVVGALSGSHISVSGPAAGLAAVVVAQIRDLGSFEAFLGAVVLAGLFQVAIGLLRGGMLANFFPGNVIRGLLAAIGILLILKQIPHLVGDDSDSEGEMSFFQPDGENTFSELLKATELFQPGAALVGLSCLALLILWPKSPLARTPVPAPLGAVLLGVLLNETFAALGTGLEIAASHLVAVPVIGENGVTWSNVLAAPDWSLLLSPAVLMAGVTLGLVASLETLLNLEATDRLDPLRRASPPNRELLAQGVGNFVSGCLGGLPVTSVIVRSSVNAQSGGRTRLATLTHGALLLVSVALLPQLLNRIPLSALAAILVITGFKLASPKLFREMWRGGHTQFVPFAATVVAIVFSDLLLGVLIGLTVSMLFILSRNLRRGFHQVTEDHIGGVVHRIELSPQTSFLNRGQLAMRFADLKEGEHVLIDARLCDYVDPDILLMIREFIEEEAPARGIHVSATGFQERYPISDVVQFVDWSTREIQEALTPARALQLLKEGNERFAQGRRLKRDLVRQIDATADGQHPIACVLSCIDSRSPAELLFDQGLGDLFSCRLAGNVASLKVLGSMEFACKAAGAKLIVVLGHTRCGAVKATCDLVASGADAAAATGLTNLGHITEPITDAVRAEAARQPGADQTARNAAFVDDVAAANVHIQLQWILDNSPVLAQMVHAGEIDIVGAMYDISTGRVAFFEDAKKAIAQRT